MSAARVRRSEFISPRGKITYRRASADHDDLVFEKSGRHALRIQSLCKVNGGEGILWSVIIDPTLHGGFTRRMGGWRAQHFGRFPSAAGNVARAGEQLPHSIIRIHRFKNHETPTGSCFAKGFDRRKSSLLFYSAHRLHELDPSAEDRFAETLQRVRKSCVPGWIGRCRVEDDVIDGETRALLG